MNTTFITIEQMEAATDTLLETAKKVGADTWQQRVKNQTPHCKFGEEGICCRICTMGPCRITPKSPRGICGCDRDGIVARNYLRFTAGGAAICPGEKCKASPRKWVFFRRGSGGPFFFRKERVPRRLPQSITDPACP